MGYAIPAVLEKEMDGRVLQHRFRYHLVRGFVAPEDIVVDLGCGTGYGSAILAEVAIKVIGIDLEADNIEHCIKNFGRENIEFKVGNLEQMELPVCDVSCAMEVLEHLHNPVPVIKKIKKATKKFIVLSVPLGQKLIWVEDKQEWQEENDSCHHYAFQTPEEIRNLFVDQNWREFHIWREGVTLHAVFYNVNSIE